MKKTRIISLIASSFLMALCLSASAQIPDACIEPEAQALRTLLQQEGPNGPHKIKLRALPDLELREAQCHARVVPSEDKARDLSRSKTVVYEQFLKQLQQAERNAPPPSDIQTGILEADQPPISEGIFSFNGGNIWQGYVDSQFYTVYAGSRYADPAQGVLLIQTESPTTGRLHIATYPCPIPTGPVQVVSESRGVLSLRSITGEFRVYNRESGSESTVTSKGDRIYTFNLKDKRFTVTAASGEQKETQGLNKSQTAGQIRVR